MDQRDRDRMIRLYKRGYSASKIAEVVGYSKSTVDRVVAGMERGSARIRRDLSLGKDYIEWKQKQMDKG